MPFKQIPGCQLVRNSPMQSARRQEKEIRFHFRGASDQVPTDHVERNCVPCTSNSLLTKNEPRTCTIHGAMHAAWSPTASRTTAKDACGAGSSTERHCPIHVPHGTEQRILAPLPRHQHPPPPPLPALPTSRGCIPRSPALPQAFVDTLRHMDLSLTFVMLDWVFYLDFTTE